MEAAAGIFTIDLPLVQEFIPAYKRGWVSALVTTLLPGGGMLAGLVASWLDPEFAEHKRVLSGPSPVPAAQLPPRDRRSRHFAQTGWLPRG